MPQTRVLQKKVCLLGSFAVGKTSLIRRFVEGRFDDRYLSSIGVKISRKTIALPELTINMILWDLAGGDEFDGVQANYLQGTAGAMIVCDLTRNETLDSWIYYAKRLHEINPRARIVLIANKCDLTEERRISDEELDATARATDAITPAIFLASAKTGVGVEKAFAHLAEQLAED